MDLFSKMQKARVEATRLYKRLVEDGRLQGRVQLSHNEGNTWVIQVKFSPNEQCCVKYNVHGLSVSTCKIMEWNVDTKAIETAAIDSQHDLIYVNELGYEDVRVWENYEELIGEIQRLIGSKDDESEDDDVAPLDPAVTAFERTRATLEQGTHTPWLLPCQNGDSVAVVLLRTTPNLKRVTKRITRGYGGGLKCNCCHDFCKDHAGTVVQEGPVFRDTHDPYQDLIRQLGQFDRFEVIDKDKATLGQPTLGGFDHLSITMEVKSDLRSKFTAEDYERFFHQNVRTMERLMSQNRGDGIIDSLKALIAVLPDVHYGDILVHSTRWFLDAMEKYLAIPDSAEPYQKFVVAAEALLAAPLSPGIAPERIICTHLKQVKDNGLNALAVANSVKGLTALLEARFNPIRYQRPTGEATAGQLEEAMKLFEGLGFCVMLMMLADIVKYDGKLFTTVTVGKDASSLWAESLAKRKKNKCTAGNFAARAGTTTTIPKTVAELFETCPSGLEIHTGGMTPVCLTTVPPSAQSMFQYKHLWGFQNGKSPSIYGISSSGWVKVNAMVFMGRNVFFGIEGARPASKMGNTCFPAFLTPAYNRRCCRAFEELNKTEMEIPDTTSKFALGVGSSRKDEYGTCHATLKFRLNGRVFSINKF